MEKYLEFCATRKNKESGLDLVANENVEESGQYTKYKREALKIMNRFSYDTYERTADFLFYVESLKCFVTVKAEKGEQVDQRLNMKLTLRIPTGLQDQEDGFDFCLFQLWKWECGGNVPKWCEDPECMWEYSASFGFDQKFLEAFLSRWLRNICSPQGEAIRICDSSESSESHRKQTAVWTAALAYRFLPKNRENRYSFACFGRPEKCRGFRIQITDSAADSGSLDLKKPPVLPDNHMETLMIRAAAEQFLEGTKGPQLPKLIDRFFVQAGDYDSLVWNFYYYMMDQNRQLQLTPGIFAELQSGLGKLQRSDLPQVERLYGWLLTQSMEQPEQTGQPEQEELLRMYLDLIDRKEACTKEQISKLWKLLELYAQGQGGKPAFLDFILQIHESSRRLYYALVGYGISSGKLNMERDHLEEILELPDFRDPDAVWDWIRQSDHQELIAEESVKEILIRKLGKRMTNDRTPQEIEKMVRCLGALDKNKCIELISAYLSEGTDHLRQIPDFCGWREYLQQREKLWKLSPTLLREISGQYENAVRKSQIPMKQDQLEALIGFGNLLCRYEEERKQKADFDRCSEAVKKGYRYLLEKCLEQVNAIDSTEQKKAFLKNVKRLLNWKPAGEENSLQFREVQEMYGKMFYPGSSQKIRNRSLSQLLGYQIWRETPDIQKQYCDWLQAVADKLENVGQVEDVLIQLEKRKQDLMKYCTMEMIYRVLNRILILCKQPDKIYWRMQTVAKAQKFGATKEFYELCNVFWDRIRIKDFPQIFDGEKDVDNFDAVIDSGDGIVCRLYEIYQTLCRDDTGDQNLRMTYEIREELTDEMAGKFFEELFKSCGQKEHLIQKRFEAIRRLMSDYWKDEERVTECIQAMRLSDNAKTDERLKELIFCKMANSYDKQEKNRRERYLPADVVCGVQLGGILGIISSLWCMMEPFDLAPVAVTIVVLLMVGIVIVAHTCRIYMDQPKTVTYSACMFSLGIWIFQLFLLKLTTDARMPAMLIGVIFTIAGTAGLILQKKRGRQNG